jgi:transposase
MNEELKYQTIKLLVDTNGNKKAAALRIGCSVRHINRMITGYRKNGKSFFIHGNQGRQPAHTIDLETKQLIIDLYRTRYSGTNSSTFRNFLANMKGFRCQSAQCDQHLPRPLFFRLKRVGLLKRI